MANGLLWARVAAGSMPVVKLGHVFAITAEADGSDQLLASRSAVARLTAVRTRRSGFTGRIDGSVKTAGDAADQHPEDEVQQDDEYGDEAGRAERYAGDEPLIEERGDRRG